MLFYSMFWFDVVLYIDHIHLERWKRSQQHSISHEYEYSRCEIQLKRYIKYNNTYFAINIVFYY